MPSPGLARTAISPSEGGLRWRSVKPASLVRRGLRVALARVFPLLPALEVVTHCQPRDEGTRRTSDHEGGGVCSAVMLAIAVQRMWASAMACRHNGSVTVARRPSFAALVGILATYLSSITPSL
jgi:hypothetical protein